MSIKNSVKKPVTHSECKLWWLKQLNILQLSAKSKTEVYTEASYFENLLFSLTRQNSRVVWLSSVDSRSTDTFGSVCFSRRYIGPVGEWWDQVTVMLQTRSSSRTHHTVSVLALLYLREIFFFSPNQSNSFDGPLHTQISWNLSTFIIFAFEFLSVKLYWCFIMHLNHFWKWVSMGITLHEQCEDDRKRKTIFFFFYLKHLFWLVYNMMPLMEHYLNLFVSLFSSSVLSVKFPSLIPSDCPQGLMRNHERHF